MRLAKLLALAAILIGLASYAAQAPHAAQGPAQDAPSLHTDQVRIVELPPTEAKHRPLYEALRRRGILEELRTLLAALRLPRPLTLELKGCDGKVDAYYDNAVATLCYEYVELIQQHGPKVGTPGGLTPADAMVGAVVDTYLHEVGHAIFDMLDIPVLGREEDAADFFSAYTMAQFAPDDARRLIQGIGFMMASEAKAALARPPMLKTFASEHGLPAQRYYNLLCVAYGSNPAIFSNAVAVGSLPQERADSCVGEYRTLHRAYRKLIAPYVDEARLREARAKVDFNWGRLISSTSGLDAPPLLQVER